MFVYTFYIPITGVNEIIITMVWELYYLRESFLLTMNIESPLICILYYLLFYLICQCGINLISNAIIRDGVQHRYLRFGPADRSTTVLYRNKCVVISVTTQLNFFSNAVYLFYIGYKLQYWITVVQAVQTICGSLYRILAWAFFVKLTSGECHKTSLMRN